MIYEGYRIKQTPKPNTISIKFIQNKWKHKLDRKFMNWYIFTIVKTESNIHVQLTE